MAILVAPPRGTGGGDIHKKQEIQYICKMKKELGKWLMDIAKYITTAVVLSSIFGDVQEKWVIYVGGSLSIVVTLLAGLWLVKDKKEGE